MKSHKGIHFVLQIRECIELIDGRKIQYKINFQSALSVEDRGSYQGDSSHHVKQKGITTTALATENVFPLSKGADPSNRLQGG